MKRLFSGRAALWHAGYAVPPLIVFALVHALGIAAPTWHQPFFGPYLDKLLHDRVLDTDFLFAPWGETRMPVGKLLVGALALLEGRWDIKSEQYIPPAVALLNLLLLYGIAGKTLGARNAEPESRLLGLAVSALNFSLTQWFCWHEPNTMHYFLCHAGFLGAVFVLSGERLAAPHWLGAAALCGVSSLSYAHGLFSWIAVAPLVLAAGRARRRPRAALAAWGALSLAVMGLYFRGYGKPMYQSDPWHWLAHPGQALAFFAMFLGAPFFPTHPTLAECAACLMLASLLFLARRESLRRRLLSRPALPWLCILSFAAFAALMAMVFRSGLSPGFGLHSRFITMGNLAAVPYLYLLHICLPERRRPLAFAVALLLLSQAIFGAESLDQWRRQTRVDRQVMACFQTASISSARCFDKLNTPLSGERIQRLVPVLEKLGAIEPFALPSGLAYAPPNWSGFVDDVSPLPRTDGAAGAVSWEASGWAILPPCRPAPHVFLTTGPRRRPLAHTVAVLERADIMKMGACYRYSGWSAAFDLQPILREPAKDRFIEAWVYDERQRRMIQLGGKALESFSRARQSKTG